MHLKTAFPCSRSSVISVVTEVGKDVTDFKVGDRVTIRAYMAGCDTKGIHERCHYCEEGDYNFCLTGDIFKICESRTHSTPKWQKSTTVSLFSRSTLYILPSWI